MIGVTVLVTLAIPRTNTWLWPAVPSSRAWRDAHLRWIVLAAMALGALIMLSRDTARRSRQPGARATKICNGP